VVKDERSAIVDRREQISEEPRPKPMYGKAEIEDTPEVKEIWRVYHHEWITVFRSQHHGLLARKEIDNFYGVKYKGRVKPEDVRVIPTSPKNQDEWPWLLQLFLPNMRGEFRDEVDARAYAKSMDFTAPVVVIKNSLLDHQIRQYGVKMLVG